MMARNKKMNWPAGRDRHQIWILRYQGTQLALGSLEFPDQLTHSSLCTTPLPFLTEILCVDFWCAKLPKDLVVWRLTQKCCLPFSLLSTPWRKKVKLRSRFLVLCLSFPYVLQGLALVIPENTPIRRWGNAIKLILLYSSGGRGTERLSGLAELPSNLMTEMHCNSRVTNGDCLIGSYRACSRARGFSVSMTRHIRQTEPRTTIQLAIKYQLLSLNFEQEK